MVKEEDIDRTYKKLKQTPFLQLTDYPYTEENVKEFLLSHEWDIVEFMQECNKHDFYFNEDLEEMLFLRGAALGLINVSGRCISEPITNDDLAQAALL